MRTSASASLPVLERTDTPRRIAVAARKRSGVGAVLGTTLIAFTLGVCGVTLYYFHKRAKVAEAQAVTLRGEVTALQSAVAGVQRQLVNANEGLAVAQAEFDRDREKLRAERDDASKRAATAQALAQQLERTVGKDDGGVSVKDGKLTLELVDRVLFPSGEAELTVAGKKVLDKVGKALRDFPDNQVWVQGHTDDTPIPKNHDLFLSNWELSTARALTVVHYLQEQGKVDPRRLAAAGFSQYRPVAKKNKARNRRIEIVLFPQDIALEK